MIGKLVGHSQPQTTQRYAHLADDPVSELNNEVSARIAAAIGSRPPNAE
jgi:site-specific recombinase XerD